MEISDQAKIYIWMGIALVDTYIIMKSDMKEPSIVGILFKEIRDELRLRIKSAKEKHRRRNHERYTDF